MATDICVFNPTSGLIDSTPGASAISNPPQSQAGAPVVLNADGLLDPTLLQAGTVATAGENLTSGNLVNLYNVGGFLYVQLAYAAATGFAPSGAPYPILAVGFVNDTVLSGGTVTVSFSGIFVYTDTHSEFSSANIGQPVYLSQIDKGGITLTPPSGIGQADETVGYMLTISGNVVTSSFNASFNTFAALSGVCQITQGGTGATSAATALQNLFGTKSANTFYAGPTTGVAAYPTFRTLAPADLTTAIGGTDTQVQFNQANVLGGDPNFIWSYSAHALGVGGIASPGKLDGVVVANFYATSVPGTPGGLSVVDISATLTAIPSTPSVSTGLSIGMQILPGSSAASATYRGITSSLMVPVSGVQPILTLNAGMFSSDYWGNAAISTMRGAGSTANFYGQSASTLTTLTGFNATSTIGGQGAVTGSAAGVSSTILSSGTGSIVEMDGVLVSSTLTGGALITTNNGVSVSTGSSGSGTITNDRGIYVGTPGTASTLTNHYGIYIADQIGSTPANNTHAWSVYTAGSAPSQFSGFVGIGTGTTAPAWALQVISPVASAPGLDVDIYSGATLTSIAGAPVTMRSARNTVVSPSAVQTADVIGGFSGKGYGATAFSTARGSLWVNAAENWTDAHQGTYLTLLATPIGSATNTEQVRILGTGQVGIGVTTPTATVTVPVGGSYGFDNSGTADTFLTRNGVGVVSSSTNAGGNQLGNFTATSFSQTGSYVQINASGVQVGNANYYGFSSTATVISIDSTITRAAAKSFNFGNNDASGTINAATVNGGTTVVAPTINATTTFQLAGNVVGKITAGTVDLITQAGDVGTTTLYAVPVSGAGLYRVSAYIIVTQAATSSSTLPSVVLTFFDLANLTQQTYTLVPASPTGNLLTTLASGNFVMAAQALTNITYATSGYASSGLTPMQFALHLRLEAM